MRWLGQEDTPAAAGRSRTRAARRACGPGDRRAASRRRAEAGCPPGTTDTFFMLEVCMDMSSGVQQASLGFLYKDTPHC